MPRQPSDSEEDSILDPSIDIYAWQNFQEFSHNSHSSHQMLFDDAGIDEFEVAEERAHLFGEQMNPDIMTYEQLLALQERIGFVNKGLTV